MAGWDTGSDGFNSLNDFAPSAPDTPDAPYPSPFYPHLSSCTSTEAFDAAFDGLYAPSTQGHSMPDASNASHNAPNDALFPSQEARDVFFYNLGASNASTTRSPFASGRGWVGLDHVTSFGLDSAGSFKFPYPFVNPTDTCDVVPPVPSLLWDERGLEQFADVPERTQEAAVPVPPALPAQAAPVADQLASEYVGGAVQAEQLDFGPWDALFASIGKPMHQDETVSAVDQMVFQYVYARLITCLPLLNDAVSSARRPEAAIKSSVPRSCKRKRAPDAETYPARPEKSKCAHSPSPAASRTSRSPTPALPEPILVVPTALDCTMSGCDHSLTQEDSAWRSHFKVAHHKQVCTDSACHNAKECKSAVCPLCPTGPKGAKTMSTDSLGRHMLNKHIGVCYRCPRCGFEKMPWRKSSCERHIETCGTGKKERSGGKKRARR